MPGLGVEFVHLVEAGAPGHIHLAADDRMDPLRLAGAVEVDGAVHGAMVGDGAGGLPHLADAPGQIPDTAGAVQETVFRMDMQVRKRHGSYSCSSSAR